MINVVSNNPALHRFELAVDGHTAATYYELAGGVITFVHTEVPPNSAARASARSWSRARWTRCGPMASKVIAQCPFVKAWIDKHPDYANLLQALERRSGQPAIAGAELLQARARRRRPGRISSAFRKSAIAPALSPSRNLAWPRLFQE